MNRRVEHDSLAPYGSRGVSPVGTASGPPDSKEHIMALPLRQPEGHYDKGCCGAPDWGIEVLSPSTAAYDQGIKRELYERHGVRELWLIHLLSLCAA